MEDLPLGEGEMVRWPHLKYVAGLERANYE